MVYTDLCSFYFSVFDEYAVDMTLEGASRRVSAPEGFGQGDRGQEVKEKTGRAGDSRALRWEPCRNQSEAVERGRHAGCG